MRLEAGDPEAKKTLVAYVGHSIFAVAAVAYFMLGSKVVSHDSEYWAVAQNVSIFSWMLGLYLFATLCYWLFFRDAFPLRLKISLKWGVANGIAAILLMPIYFVSLHLEVSAKSKAQTIVDAKWYLVERISGCGRGRRGRLFRNCKNFSQKANVYRQGGKVFKINRYGDMTKYQCVLAEGAEAPGGKQWLKVIAITSVKYETDYYGNLTQKGKIDLVKCTRRDPQNPLAQNST